MILFFSFYTAYPQVGRIEPFDESGKDTSLVLFIEQLKKAVRERDKEFIRRSVAEVSYIPSEGGETTTPDEFYAYYFGEQGRAQDLWASLEYVFDIGGGGFKTSAEGELQYFMPYTAANLHEGAPFTELGSYVIALSDTTRVYYKPTGVRAILALLDYEIMPVNIHTYIPGWKEVELASGEMGYVMSKDVIYTIDKRCGLVRSGGMEIKVCGCI